MKSHRVLSRYNFNKLLTVEIWFKISKELSHQLQDECDNIIFNSLSTNLIRLHIGE